MKFSFKDKIRKNKRGFLILDVLLAFTLATLFVSSLSFLSLSSKRILESARAKSLLLTEEGLPSMDVNEYVDYLNNIDTPICTTDFINTPVHGSYEYRKRVNIFHNENITTPLTDIRIESTTLPIASHQIITSMKIIQNSIFISTDSNIASDSDFFIINIADWDNPYIVTEINTGPGLSDFVMIGKYIYASAISTAYQLHVLERSAPNILSLANRVAVSTPTPTTTPPQANTINYKSGHILLGTNKWPGKELIIFNISDMVFPREISSLEIGSVIKSIDIYNDYAYISGANMNQLSKIKIAELLSPNIESLINPSGYSRQEGTGISKYGEYLVYGRTSGGFNITNDHELFFWPEGNTLDLISATSTDIANGIYNTIQDKYRVLAFSRDTQKALNIFSKTPLVFGTVREISLSVKPLHATCDQNTVYFLSDNSGTLYKLKLF